MTNSFAPLFFNGKRLAGFLLLLCIACSYSYSQSPDTTPKLGVIRYSRPLIFDSTQTLEEQYRKENPYFLLGLQLFLPPVIDANEGPIVFGKPGAIFPHGNSSFTLVAILSTGGISEIRKKKLINVCGFKYKEAGRGMHAIAVFVLRENKNQGEGNQPFFYWVVLPADGSTYSGSSFNAFIPIPYLEKQKQIYEGQQLIMLKDKEKWACLKVDVLKGRDAAAHDSVYDVYCILKRQGNQLLVLRPPSEKYGRPFLTEKEYERLDHANRNQKLEMKEAEKKLREMHLTSCIARFGTENGKLIAEQTISIGMSAEMCRAAWGEPWEISKGKSPNTKAEYWYYSEKYVLHFENRQLTQIRQEK
jgi:hypothetical protein